MDLKLSEFILSSLTSISYSTKRFFLHRDKYRTWKYTFQQVYDGACHFARLIEELGFSKGDHILIKCKNSPEWVVTFIGCILKGCVLVPLDYGSNPDFDIKVNLKVRAKAIVADDMRSCAHFKDFAIEKILLEQITEMLDSKKTTFKPVKTGPDDLMEIVFTSGTTAEPKGVMITYKNIEANLVSVQEVMKKYDRIFRIMAGPKILSLVPLSHMYGQLIGILTPLMIGSSVMFAENLSPNYLLRVIKEEKIWILGILPKLLEMLKNQVISKFNLDNEGFNALFLKMKTKRWQLRLLRFWNIHVRIGWRLVAFMVGGAVLEPSVDEFWRCLAYSMFQGYGLTETAPLITLSDPIGSYSGSIGKVLPGQEIKVKDGELYIRGPNVSAGYFEDEKRSSAAFKDGWFRTGDLVELDKSGNVFFRGRKDDRIVRSSGLNVFPEDIEKQIKATGAVRDCVVMGIRSDGTDDIWAVLLLKEGIKTSAEEIIRKANQNLGAYQKVDNYFIWEEPDLPRTPTMKVKKGEVKKILGKRIQIQGQKDKKILHDSMSFGISKLITKLHKTGRRALKPQDRLEDDVGLDSLELIELTSEIEKQYNIDLDDTIITRDTTVKELERIISAPPRESRRLPFYSFPYWTAVRIIRTIFQYILFPFISVLYISKIKGKENLKDLKGPVVFAANHSSNLDTFVVMYSLPLKIRYWLTTLMSIEYHFQNFFYRRGNWLRRFIEAAGFYLLVNLAINACPLSRTHGFKQVIENVGKLIDRGWSILIFPEGMVTTDGKIHDFESGIGIIAADMKVPVVPVKIEGLYNILRDGILPWGHRPRCQG